MGGALTAVSFLGGSIPAAVVAGLLTAAIIHIWHRAIQALRKFSASLEVIKTFGRQWEQAVALDAEIRAERSELQALAAQMGTAGRHPDWASVEAYLHEWRHEWRDHSAGIALGLEAIDKILTRTQQPERN